MARKPPQLPDPARTCWLDGGESPVSQITKGLSVNPDPGWATRRAERSQPSVEISAGVATPPLKATVPTVPKEAPAVKRTSPQVEISSLPETPAQPRLVVPLAGGLSRAASRREAARYATEPGVVDVSSTTCPSTSPCWRMAEASPLASLDQAPKIP